MSQYGLGQLEIGVLRDGVRRRMTKMIFMLEIQITTEHNFVVLSPKLLMTITPKT